MRRLLLSIPLILAVGCAHTEAKKDQPTTPPSASNTPKAVAQTPTNTCNNDVDCGDKQLCIRNQCVDITNGLAECSSVRVHFALNSSDIDSGDRPNLERSARCLKADHALHVAVEGNADERGTEEYNLALGDRRATAVKKYLEALGSSPAQLKTVSYGKENPLCTEHDEDCWQKNRRAELKLAEGAAKKTKHHQ